MNVITFHKGRSRPDKKENGNRVTPRLCQNVSKAAYDEQKQFSVVCGNEQAAKATFSTALPVRHCTVVDLVKH